MNTLETIYSKEELSKLKENLDTLKNEQVFSPSHEILDENGMTNEIVVATLRNRGLALPYMIAAFICDAIILGTTLLKWTTWWFALIWVVSVFVRIIVLIDNNTSLQLEDGTKDDPIKAIDSIVDKHYKHIGLKVYTVLYAIVGLIFVLTM